MWTWKKVKVNRFQKLLRASPKNHSWQVLLKLVKQFKNRSRLKVFAYMVNLALDEGQGQLFSQNFRKLERVSPKNHSLQVLLCLAQWLQSDSHLNVSPYIITVTLDKVKVNLFFFSKLERP